MVKYETDFRAQWRAIKTIEGEFGLDIDVFFKTKSSDLDNAFKVILDCLQNVSAISNDNLCYEITARKHIDKINPRIEFSLIKL